jgi:hypothetical protein
MTAALPEGTPLRLVIRELAIHSTSAIDARRLADAIVPALTRELAGGSAALGGPAARSHPSDRPSHRSSRQAERAAAAIAVALGEALEVQRRWRR